MKRLTIPRIGKRAAFTVGAVLLAVPLAVGAVVGTAQAGPTREAGPAR
jgi:hypothetical protein